MGKERHGDDYDAGRNPPYSVAISLCEPDGAVRAGRDTLGDTAECRSWKFGNGTSWCNPTNVAAPGLREPQVPVRPCRNARRLTADRGKRKLGDNSACCDPADFICKTI